MNEVMTSEDDLELSLADHHDPYLQTAYGGPDCQTCTQPRVSQHKQRERSLGQFHVGWQRVAATLQSLRVIAGLQNPEMGIFFDSRLQRRRPVNQEKDTDQFHDSESEDVYDLYNACNGVMSGGLLDVNKLDELSPQERKVLDVGRLREIWEHTATGCIECAAIIRTLNRARRVSPEDADELSRNKLR